MIPTRGLVALAAGVVVAVGGIPRVLLAAGALPDALRPFVWSDALLVYQRGLSGHRVPYADSPFEYPPLIGAIAAAFSLISPGPALFVALWAVLVAAAAAAVAFLLYPAAGSRVWRYWVFAPQLALLGTVNFDLIPAALLTAGAVAARRGREISTSAAIALGTAAKLYPVASLPVALFRARRKAAALLVFVCMLLAFYLPTSVLPFASAGGVAFYAMGIRSNIDSVWGILERALDALGFADARVFVVVLTLAGLGATYVLFVLPRAVRMRDPVSAFALATLVMMLWSRLYSPQYSLWILPFVVMLAGTSRGFMLLAIADVGVFFTIYPLSLVAWGPGHPAAAALVAALSGFVVLRHFALWRIWRGLERGDTPIAQPREAHHAGERDDEDQRDRA